MLLLVYMGRGSLGIRCNKYFRDVEKELVLEGRADEIVPNHYTSERSTAIQCD